MATNRVYYFLLTLGSLLLGVTGFFPKSAWSWLLACEIFGLGFLVLGEILARYTRMTTVLPFIVATNLSFWVSVGLWLLRITRLPWLSGGDPDVFSGTVALWVLGLSLATFYELVFCVWKMLRSGASKTAIAGVVLALLQIPTAILFGLRLVAGV